MAFFTSVAAAVAVLSVVSHPRALNWSFWPVAPFWVERIPEGTRADQGHLMLRERVAPHSNVIRAILLEYSPYFGCGLRWVVLRCSGPRESRKPAFELWASRPLGFEASIADTGDGKWSAAARRRETESGGRCKTECQLSPETS